MSQIHGQNPSKDSVEIKVDANGRLLTSTTNDTAQVAATATGNITTQNVGAPNGNAVTAASTVSLTTNGSVDTASIQVTGTYTGALSVQVQLDNTNWVTLSGATSLTNAASGAQSATIASAAVGIFQLDVSGFMGVRVTALAAMTGTAVVTIAAGAGSGIVGIDTPIVLAAGSATIGAVTANNPAGTTYSLVTAASTNAASVKASAGRMYELTVSNPTATAAYVKLYNKASAPTVGTDVPVLTIPVPATAAGVGTVALQFGTIGKNFGTGIAIAVTAAAVATDTGVTVAGIQINGTYI